MTSAYDTFSTAAAEAARQQALAETISRQATPFLMRHVLFLRPLTLNKRSREARCTLACTLSGLVFDVLKGVSARFAIVS